MKLMVLIFFPVWLNAQAPKDSMIIWLAAANLATIGQIAIRQINTRKPFHFEFSFDKIFTDDQTAQKKAYDVLKNRMYTYDAARALK